MDRVTAPVLVITICLSMADACLAQRPALPPAIPARCSLPPEELALQSDSLRGCRLPDSLRPGNPIPDLDGLVLSPIPNAASRDAAAMDRGIVWLPEGAAEPRIQVVKPPSDVTPRILKWRGDEPIAASTVPGR